MNVKQLLVLAGMAAVFILSACNSKKKIQSPTEGHEIILPFSESKYKSDKDFFRAKQLGKSPDLATAKKIALLNAKSELAGNIKSTVKRVAEQYTNQRKIGDKQEYSSKFEEMTIEVVNQTLTDIKIIDEKVFKEIDGSFSFWVAIEASKITILEGVNNKILQNAKMQQDYDRKIFEEIFNNEMQKLAKEQQ